MTSDPASEIFAKLAGLYKMVTTALLPSGRYYDPKSVLEYFERFAVLQKELKAWVPIYRDMPERDIPEPSGTSDFDGRGYITREYIERLLVDIEYIFEVRSHSKLKVPESTSRPERIFISHGTSNEWRKVQAYVERDLDIPTLELAQEPNMGRTVLQKLTEESDKCRYAIVVLTGDDAIDSKAPRARENVMHEIGYFQGKFGLENVCLLYEEGTNIPSNIHGLAYIPFPKGLAEATFGAIQKELRSVFRE